MRVFLAGATGVIGRSLVGRLIDAGHEVVGMTRSPTRAEDLRRRGVEPVVCDALDGTALARALAEARADALIHELTELPSSLAPRAFARQLAATNRLRREGTRNLVAAAQAAGVNRLVAQSVAFAYAPTGDWVKDESAPLALDAEPPMDKMVGAIHALEHQVLEAGGIVLRYGFFYGAGTHFAADGFYARMVRWRLFPTVGSGEGRWSFIHVDDAAAATVAALERGSPGVYNIVDDDPAPVREWLPVYAQANGGPRPLHVPAWLGRLAGGSAGMAAMTTQRAAGNTKAKRELGWEPEYASWRDGFHATAA